MGPEIPETREGCKALSAYCAGLIDGEGCIGIYSAGVGVRRLKVSVNMTHEETIRFLHGRYGGSFCSKKVPAQNQPQWWWGAHSATARAVIRDIRPFLIAKAADADKLIDHWVRRGSW